MNFPARPIRFGVIGCGVIAYWTHLRELKHMRGAQLVAAADPDSSARDRAGHLARIPTHATASELLARSDIDAVVISAPTPCHADLAIEAVRAGKHVYLEKPVATSVAEGQRLAEAIRGTEMRVVVGFNRRCHPVYLQARRLIRSGALGAVRTAFSSFSEPVTFDSMPGWKRSRSTGGGVLLDLASHHADLLRWFLDTEVAQVEASIESLVTEHDQAYLRITMESGVTAQTWFSFHAARADYFEFIGDRGTLRVDRHNPTLALRVSRRFGYGVRSVRVFPSRETLAWRARRILRPSYESSYRKALENFAATIRGSASSNASLDDGLRSLEIVLAAEESARLMRPVLLGGARPIQTCASS